ncbi:MAG: hypothetical protein M1814_000299 [Vezdaea aestivalis]|nr:MAG: hypothetical protein M1814_000299 [Vezdaea aestivalis]
MAVLQIILDPRAVHKFHNAVICLSKFSEEVTLTARKDKFLLTGLNSSKTGYVAFIFETTQGFSKYSFKPLRNVPEFTFKLMNKSLASVFKGRLGESRDKSSGTALDRCELSVIDDPNQIECRFMAKMICRNGVLKTYKLTYEAAELFQARFDTSSAINGWEISSRTVRDLVEYFGQKTEFLDFYAENGRITFTSYTEKISNGKGLTCSFYHQFTQLTDNGSLEILKQPLQTSVTLDTYDFLRFDSEEGVHIAISVKDFKALAAHADTIDANISAQYTSPTRPMKLSYEAYGLHCEFVLMTHSDTKSTPSTQGPERRLRSTTPHVPNLQPSTRVLDRSIPQTKVDRAAMPPPFRPTTQNFEVGSAHSGVRRPSPPLQTSDLDTESLFVQDGDDHRWDPQTADDVADAQRDVLGWDTVCYFGFAVQFCG